jgi:hypothetical protein
LLQLLRQAVPEFETTIKGSRVATSVGGVLTGRGADIIVIDDPLKPEEALSQTQRQTANEWYDHTLYSRLNDKLKGAIVLITHGLHESLPSGKTRGRPRGPRAGGNQAAPTQPHQDCPTPIQKVRRGRLSSRRQRLAGAP